MRGKAMAFVKLLLFIAISNLVSGNAFALKFQVPYVSKKIHNTPDDFCNDYMGSVFYSTSYIPGIGTFANPGEDTIYIKSYIHPSHADSISTFDQASYGQQSRHFTCLTEYWREFPGGSGKYYLYHQTSPISGSWIMFASNEKYFLEVLEDEHIVGNCKAGSGSFKYNPIDISNGNKVHNESLLFSVDDRKERFSYSYQSARDHTGSLGSKWTFMADQSITRNEGLIRSGIVPDYVSRQNYTTPKDACMSGWDAIKSRYSYSWINGSYATFSPPTMCSIIKNDGTIWRTVPINAGYYFNVKFYIYPSYISLKNSDIDVNRFYGGYGAYGGVWRSEFDKNDAIEDVFDSDNHFIGYRHINKNDETVLYDANGRLIQVVALDGTEKQIIYSDQNTIFIKDSLNHILRLERDGAGRIYSVKQGGGEFLFGYDASNNLSSIEYPDGSMRTYVYEDSRFPNHLTGIVDENGNRYATWAYDSQGRAILSEHAGGVERGTLTYNADGTTLDVDALGQTRTHYFETINGIKRLVRVDGPACASCGGNTQTTTYDTNGNPNLVTNFNGTVTDYDHDLTRNLEIKRIEAKGTANERTISTEWHPTYRLPMRIAEPLKRITYTRDSKGNILTKTEQATTDVNGSQGFNATLTGTPRTWSYTYNSFGQVLTADGPRTDVSDITTYSYDPVNGNLLSITNALGHLTQITHHDASGRPLRTVDANGLVTQLSYTPRGWTDLIKVGTDTVYETTDLDYDGVGQLKKATLPDGSYLSYTYDAAHRLTDIQDQDGNTIHYTLDLMGNRTATEVKDPNGTLKRTQRSVYNTLNRLTQSLGADKGPDTQITYYDEYDNNGNLKKVRDAQGNTTQYGYDALDRLTSVIDALNGTTRYQYNGQGQLTQVTDPRGNITSYQYDGLGNLTQLTSPDTGVTRYSAYDGAGNLLSQTDAKGQTTGYQYDALNRLTRISYADGTATVYQYDSGANALGRLSTIVTPSATTAYEYDRHGRITRKSETIGTQTQAIAYHYNSAGQLDQITYPSGKVIGYGYTGGKISRITVDGVTALDNIRYDPFGPTTGWQLGSGPNAISRLYDLDGQLSSYTLGNATRQLGYANTGNITAITEPGNAANDQSYGYDALYRLTGYSGPGQTDSYGYDANGNRTSATLNGAVNSYTTALTSNRLQSAHGKSYQYDANGNITSDGLNGYSYDARNRLIGLNGGSGAGIGYSHNGLGQRIGKTLPGIDLTSLAGDANNDGAVNAQDYSLILDHILGLQTVSNSDCNEDGQTNVQDLVCVNIKTNGVNTTGTTRYAYDEQGQLIGEYDQSGNAIQETVYLGNLPVAVLKQGNVYYIHADHLNTPRLITDASNAAYWSWVSEPFGTTAANEDVDVDGNGDGDGNKFSYNLRFPGQYFDQETGLHYNYYRDYDPGTGRYITSDPIGLKGGLNTYTYVLNNPLRWTDPRGLEVQICCRPAQIAGGLIDHCWVKTDTVSGGMGANPNIPPGQQWEGYGMPVQITDHSKDKPTQCTTQQNVDEQCVNNKLQIGKPIGRFMPPINQCQSFAYGTVNSCRTGPQIPAGK